MKRTLSASFTLPCLVALFLGLTSISSGTAWSATGEIPPGVQLEPIPTIDDSPLEEAVALHLQQARSEMKKVLAEPGACPERLADAYGTLGQHYHAYELYDPAGSCYRNAKALDPQNFRWLHLLGDVLRNLAQLEEAIGQFQGAWALEPRDFPALVYIGVVYGYGRVVNTALHQSEFMPKTPKQLVDATSYLVYALTGIILLEYVTLAWNFGPQNANHDFVLKVIVLFIVLLVIMKNLGSFEIRERVWIPLLGRKRAGSA